MRGFQDSGQRQALLLLGGGVPECLGDPRTPSARCPQRNLTLWDTLPGPQVAAMAAFQAESTGGAVCHYPVGEHVSRLAAGRSLCAAPGGTKDFLAEEKETEALLPGSRFLARRDLRTSWNPASHFRFSLKSEVDRLVVRPHLVRIHLVTTSHGRIGKIQGRLQSW